MVTDSLRHSLRCVLEYPLQSRMSALFLALILQHVALSTTSNANDLEIAQEHFRLGRYAEAIEVALPQVEKRVWNEAWPRLLIEAYLVVGKNEEALRIYETSIDRFGDSLRLRMLGHRVYQLNNLAAKAERQLVEAEDALRRAPWRYSNRSELVAVGEFYLLRGEDPKQVLKICFDQALKQDPKNLEALLATARMALDKNDASVAARSLEKALELDGNNPEVLFLAAKAWQETEVGERENFLARALELNPRHTPSLLWAAQRHMDAELYPAATQVLAQIELINPMEPSMWGLRAAIAHLMGDYENEGVARKKALSTWKLNPEVDHLIGKHLSLHYRFREGVEYQRRALAMDSGYAPARAQLAQDLLRLGETDEGWALVDGVRKSDPYDVSIFNLKQLQSKLAQFNTLEIPGFVIRMDAKEATVYGQDVCELLSNAREVLVSKYDVVLEEPVFVEIFPRQQEFAIRTFGLPGGAGFLGVCFGRLITANSPAALNVDSNWRSVLWHEYCHVVTLQKTKNRMPRWLSEGISVYEERQRNDRWGERLDPVYLKMLSGNELAPLSELSGSFLHPKSPMHLQFAYFEASLAVEFWIQQYGMQGLRKLLDDLSVGMRPEEALARLPGSLDALNADFEVFARDYGRTMSERADFTPWKRDENVSLQSWLETHPNSYSALRMQLDAQTKSEEWEDASKTAARLIELWPEDTADEGIYFQRANIVRQLGDRDQERSMLVELSRRASSPRSGLLRLVEIDRERGDWNSVAEWADLLVGIAPLSDEVQQARYEAAIALNHSANALRALLALEAMDPVDPSMLHFRIAKAAVDTGDRALAKRHCLIALEESPRFLDALQLLLELQ